MKIYLAPILGMTNYRYRNLFTKYFGGIDKYFAPFVTSVNAEIINPTLLKDLMPERNSVEYLVPQILSNNGDDFKRMAKAIIDLGYKEVNWNIGCPFSIVTRKNKGAGILAHPDKIRQFLDIVMNNPVCPVSIKMRLGMNDIADFRTVIPIINEYPVSELIIHGRTGKQAYKGVIHKNEMAEAFSLSTIPTVYNGDIFEYSDYELLTKHFPDTHTFMLGRGALSNPFLPSRMKGIHIDSSKKQTILKQFHDELYTAYENSLYGGKHLMDKMKSIWIYLAVHLKEGDELLKNIKRAKTVDTYNIVLSEYFGKERGWNEENGLYYFIGTR